MKKLFKIPALLFTLMLIVSSCGRSAKSDAETLNSDDLFELVSEASNEEDSKKKIKLYKEASKDMDELIEIMEYYSEDEGNYEKLVKAMEELDEDEEIPSYKDFKKMMKPFIKQSKEDLEAWNDDLEKLKDGKSLVSPIERDAKEMCEIQAEAVAMMQGAKDGDVEKLIKEVDALKAKAEKIQAKYKEGSDEAKEMEEYLKNNPCE